MSRPVPTVVVVEDDRAIADLVELYLRGAGYHVVVAGDAEAGRRATADHQPDLVLLDVGLPDLSGLEVDGFELCRQLRRESSVPVILLTARDGEIDRVLGFELGADDYVVKPFSPRELVARVRAVLRRSGEAEPGPAVLRLGDLEVDVGRREVRVSGEPVALATREFALLQHLAERPGLALSRRQLLDGAWGHDWYGDERTVDVHVAQLRAKLGADCPIETVRGVGYRVPSP